MKKFIFLLAITLMASFTFLSAQNLVLKNQEPASAERATLKHNPTRADGYLTYMDIEGPGLAWVLGWDNFTPGSTYHVSTCINFTAAQMEQYVGGTLHSIDAPLPDANWLTGLTTCKVWIKGSLTGAVIYEQIFTPVIGYWTEVTLNTPYVIPAGSFVIGVTTTHVIPTAGGAVRPIWVEDGADHPYEPGGCNYNYSTSPSGGYGSGASWSQYNQQGNLGIIGYVSGIQTQPTNDLAATIIKQNSTVKMVGQQYSYTVTIKNVGLVAQNNYTVQLIDGANNVLASQQVTTNLAPNATTNINLNYTAVTEGAIAMKGKVILTGDESATNDVTDPMPVIFYAMQPMGYCTLANDNAYGATQHPNSHSAAIGYLAADMGPLVGKKLTAIDFCIPVEPSNLNNCTVWVRSSKNGTNLYSQAFTPTFNGWNRVVLNTPYVLQNTNTYIGYTVNTIESCFPLSYSANSPGNPEGGHFAIGTTWYTLSSQGKTGNMNILGAIDGACDPVTNLAVNYNAECNAVLTWTAPAGATKFNVYRGTTLIAEEIGTPTYTDTENSPGQGYTWKVTVVCTGGGESSPSFIAKDACMTKPAPVTNLDVNYNVDCHAVITWTASANATYYKVLRGTDIIAPNVTATTFTDVESHPAIGYKWSVVACNPAGESTATAVTKDACITLPAPVTDFEVVYTPECHASLTWTATTSNIAIGYKVYRETDLIATINSVDETTYIDEDFENIGHKWLVKILCKFDIESNPAEKQLGVCVGIKDNVKTKFSIIPNPAKNNIAVNAENNFHTIEILSFLGQVVYSQPNVGSQASLDITNLSNGVYFVRIISDSSTSVKKFVKQ